MRIVAAGRLIVLAVLVAVSPLRAQQPTMLFGVVTNANGLPLKGVELTVANSTLRVISNDSGVYIFESPPTGRVRVLARRIGFKPLEKGFKVDPGQNRQLDFSLDGIPELLDSVLVMTQQGGTSRMAEFWNRRQLGVGAFITRADIERRKPYNSIDILRNVTGVRIIGDDNPMGRPVVTMGRTAIGVRSFRNVASLAGDCRVNYYVDGMWIPAGSFHPDDISPVNIEAMEIYRGAAEIPPKFRARETACGLIVIWTREPPAVKRADRDTVPESPRH